MAEVFVWLKSAPLNWAYKVWRKFSYDWSQHHQTELTKYGGSFRMTEVSTTKLNLQSTAEVFVWLKSAPPNWAYKVRRKFSHDWSQHHQTELTKYGGSFHMTEVSTTKLSLQSMAEVFTWLKSRTGPAGFKASSPSALWADWKRRR